MTTEQQDTRCRGCGWDAPVCRCDELQDFDDDCEPDEWEEHMQDCHGFFEQQIAGPAVFVCGAAGSEDCDECMCNPWLGLTEREIDELPEDPE